MNSRERIIATLEHRQPDRVAVAEAWIDPQVARAIFPDACDRNDLAEYLDLDMVTIYTMVYGDEEIEWVDRDKGVFRDRWGALQHLIQEAIPMPMGPPRVESQSDLNRYVPPDPAASPVIEKVRHLRERFPEKAVTVVGESGWAPAVYLRSGIQNLFLDMVQRPDFVKPLLDIGAEYYAQLYPLVIEAGADVILLGDDYSDKTGPMMSPSMFEDLILPRDVEVVASIKQAGGYCIKHSDGDIRKIMDGLVEAGVDALGPLEDVPGMEMDRIFERYPGRIAVMGNLSVDLLSRGKPEQVREATKKLMQQVSANGPHILSSGNTISSSVRPENYLAMVQTARDYGQYVQGAEGATLQFDA